MELCAGIGGQALGLHSAGFRFIGLCDSRKHAVDTLKANCPRWTPWMFDIRKEKLQLFDQLDQSLAKTGSPTQLDLLSASLPWRPWDESGTGESDPEDLLVTFKEFVNRYQPKAFLFETVEHFIGPRHRGFYLRTVDQFAKADYRTFVVQPYFPDFGIPRENDKIFVVGLKNEFARDFRFPLLSRPNSRSFLELTAPIAFRERSAWSLGDMTARGRTKIQRDYDKWCEQWLTAHRDFWDALLPRLNRGLDKGLKARPEPKEEHEGRSTAMTDEKATLGFDVAKRKELSQNTSQENSTLKKQRGRPRKTHELDYDYLRIDPPISSLWREFGFNVEKRKRIMPRPGDKLPSKLPMTPDLLKQLQGFPSYWKLEGELADQFTALHDATPSVIAMALGRSIHAALSKRFVDIDTAGALTPELKLFFFGSLYSSRVLESHNNPALSLAEAWHDGVLAMRGELQAPSESPHDDDDYDDDNGYEPDPQEWEDLMALNDLLYDE
jgi:site-specific DNA-cytosine methylase